MSNTKNLLLASAAAFAMSASSALAFDEVNWSWDLVIDETITKTVNVDININPTGLVNDEVLQVQIGDVTATSSVSGISNNTIGGEAGEGGTVTVTVDDVFNLTTTVDDSEDPSVIAGSDLGLGEDEQLSAQILGGTLDEGTDVLNLEFAVQGEFEVTLEPGELVALDAADLPKIESVATAVGNNISINSSVPVEEHSGQFLVGGFPTDEGEEGRLEDAQLLAAILAQTPDTGNSNLDIAGALALSSALGLIEPATISATSTVTDILNATVDSAATAVGNNKSITVEASTADDALVLADVTQFAFADITATSSVTAVDINNYTGFGEAGFGNLAEVQTPIISSVATAVGNNLSINVSSPAVGGTAQ